MGVGEEATVAVKKGLNNRQAINKLEKKQARSDFILHQLAQIVKTVSEAVEELQIVVGHVGALVVGEEIEEEDREVIGEYAAEIREALARRDSGEAETEAPAGEALLEDPEAEADGSERGED